MLSLSNILIGISALATLAGTLFPGIYLFGMNDIFLDQGYYHIYIIQFFSSVFLHGGIFHLFANSVFVYIFGNQVEDILGAKKYLLFFVISCVFVGIGVTFLSDGNTVGISGFGLAILSYYTLLLRSKKHPDYKGGITAIILSIGIGLMPGISLVGHLFGALFGIIFYLLDRDFYKKCFVGEGV
ncbi:rhomboid family intramembrane serine protease [Candidatus Gracilibacteria bacterium]|nr:rhomboid family intramembrane serine protease [Candidatus Gracilibacteria bacterium]